MLITALTLSYA